MRDSSQIGSPGNLFKPTSQSGGMSFFNYEFHIATQLVIPWLKQRFDLSGWSVVEWGSHHGGLIEAFRQKTSVATAVGYELNGRCVAESPFISDHAFRLEIGDALDLPSNDGLWDLIILKDVLEHIPDTAQALQTAYNQLKCNGRILITFPPYYSAFGGHQQTASNWTKIIPFLHYLPASIFNALIRTRDNGYMSAEDAMEDMRSVQQTRLTLGKLEQLARQTGLTIAESEFYLLRPEFKLRYGFPSCRLNSLSHLPIIRELLVMGVCYLLEKPVVTKATVCQQVKVSAA